MSHTDRPLQEDVWGVVDILANTDFPDMRFKCIVQRSSGPLIVSWTYIETQWLWQILLGIQDNSSGRGQSTNLCANVYCRSGPSTRRWSCGQICFQSWRYAKQNFGSKLALFPNLKSAKIKCIARTFKTDFSPTKWRLLVFSGVRYLPVSIFSRFQSSE